MTDKKAAAIEPAEKETIDATTVKGAADLSLKSEAQSEKKDGDPIHQIDFNSPSALVPEVEQVEENLKKA